MRCNLNDRNASYSCLAKCLTVTYSCCTDGGVRVRSA